MKPSFLITTLLGKGHVVSFGNGRYIRICDVFYGIGNAASAECIFVLIRVAEMIVL